MGPISKLSLCSVIIALTATTPTFAQDETEGRRLALMAFESVDRSDPGYLDQAEFLNFGYEIFFRMDTNQSNDVTLNEFLAFDNGMRSLAVEEGQEAAHDTALRVVYAFWDRNGDGKITRREHRLSLSADFDRADADGDALLTEDEFTGGFSIMVALRSAINPAPLE